MKTLKQMIDEDIDSLVERTNQLFSKLEILHDNVQDKTKISVSKEKLDEIFYLSEDISRDMFLLQKSNLQLYENRGNASSKKAISSKENGKKGGRPPKEISDAKKRLEILDEKFYNCKISKEEEAEMEELQLKILRWKNSKINKDEE